MHKECETKSPLSSLCSNENKNLMKFMLWHIFWEWAVPPGARMSERQKFRGEICGCNGGSGSLFFLLQRKLVGGRSASWRYYSTFAQTLAHFDAIQTAYYLYCSARWSFANWTRDSQAFYANHFAMGFLTSPSADDWSVDQIEMIIYLIVLNRVEPRLKCQIKLS